MVNELKGKEKAENKRIPHEEKTRHRDPKRGAHR